MRYVILALCLHILFSVVGQSLSADHLVHFMLRFFLHFRVHAKEQDGPSQSGRHRLSASDEKVVQNAAQLYVCIR